MSIDLQSSFSGTRPVAPAHAFDIGRLAEWMREHVDGFNGRVNVEQFKGGQSNPTFLLESAGGRYVLRRKPPGELLPSAHAVEREYRVIRALAQTDVPVAKTFALCEDAGVIGSPFYLMEYVEGRIFWDAALPDMTSEARAAIYGEMNRVIAALHSVDPDAIGLGDYGRTGNYIERQVARWTRQYRASETERIEAADALIDWLPEHIPRGDERRIVHGDYRLDNVVFHPHEARIVAVLDWELSTLGHPLVDFAYHCMIWHMQAGARRGLVGLDIAALGIPDEKTYLKRYLEKVARASRSAVPEADWGYYLVFNMFRLVGILQGVMARALQGNASSALALETGRRTRPLAEQAWALARQVDALR
ncbi:aminoglycoside phosphotransferase (APT) family kinase protein [Paraburkholderia bannensis]|uniref:Aminoglycoside phosphotransferase (APT) family kinase protein n=1 Tax=Paraburkholderia bannensis TaxID=765414 RepID=A0A7W9U5U3_9BURK|nr:MULTISPECIES: phosphotransferase [Paraburkholderia]MBB3261841.1 aminoglycoside phosphotransferase (APT) family kinase protein [Paraburkholderia sp. WP4_3_2]MBB6106836.1 aminoglycoside phosphotransferase (APT) family kinase protein [Paraburkholderia bannensis]